jgi:hypothetical protein
MRMLLIIGAGLLASIAAAIALSGLHDRRPVATDRTVEPVADIPSPEASLPGRDTLREPALEVPAERALPLMVATFAPGQQQPLDSWLRTDASAGFFDTLSVMTDAGLSPIDEVTKLDGNARLMATGWAGDTQLGIQLSDVLLSQCGLIVARARVDGDRPDVAAAVHPNLERSGWKAILFAADLPQCNGAKLSAWAIVPASPAVLMSLVGTHDAGVIDPAAATAYHLAALPLPDAADIKPLPASEIDVIGARVNLRRCGSTDCSRVGQVGKGRYRVQIAARRDGWTLLVFGDRGGWLFDKLYETVQ